MKRRERDDTNVGDGRPAPYGFFIFQMHKKITPD